MGSALNEISEKAINAASAIGIFYINEKSSKNYVLAGQYIEKIWLEASACNISVQPILAPIFLFSKSEYNELDEFDTHEISIIKNLHKNFKSVTGDTDNHAVFIFRFFIDSESPKKSLRRPLEEILNFGE